ncbi:MAG: reverse transcriptase family protein [Phycisphaerae bacterium]|nr:reverse transcriptase family protein [Phycisphaerae bacterium]
MGLGDFFRRLFSVSNDEMFAQDLLPSQGSRDVSSKGKLGVNELARRLGISVEQLQAVPIAYSEFTIPKRSGGKRTILAPRDELKSLQRKILRRLLGRLRCHSAATGFQRGQSIVTNARPHIGAAVLLKMDIKEFFPSTTADRLKKYFKYIGWDKQACKLLLEWTTHKGALPQGAPTSPRLSNLVNFAMDARLAGLAKKFNAAYTRYADDMTFSFATDDRQSIYGAIASTKKIVGQCGYKLHQKRKLRLARKHQRQCVTGLVVNEKLALPRRTRRWLRAVEHRLATGGQASLSPAQLAGWKALQAMIESS